MSDSFADFKQSLLYLKMKLDEQGKRLDAIESKLNELSEKLMTKSANMIELTGIGSSPVAKRESIIDRRLAKRRGEK